MEATKTKLVDYRVKNAVAWIELTDPPANTYTYEMMRDLDECILKARFDPLVHVIVIRGAGDKFFCAGANIKMLQTVDPTFKYFFCLHANETLNRLEQTPKLVIAAINGHCVGGGLEIAMAADIRIAKRNAGIRKKRSTCARTRRSNPLPAHRRTRSTKKRGRTAKPWPAKNTKRRRSPDICRW